MLEQCSAGLGGNICRVVRSWEKSFVHCSEILPSVNTLFSFLTPLLLSLFFPFFFSRGCVIHPGKEREREPWSLLSLCEKNGTFDQESSRVHSPEQQETSRCCHITAYLSVFSWPNVIFPKCTLKCGSFVIYVAVYAASKQGPVAAMCQYVPCDCVICQHINKVVFPWRFNRTAATFLKPIVTSSC